MIPAALNEQIWWYVARSSGFVAWATVTASVLWGLALSTRLMGKVAPAKWVLEVHRYLGALSVVFVGIHLGGLVLDDYVHFGWLDILVPGAAGWKPGPVAWGVVGMYLLVAIEITSFAMHRIPRKLWRWVHFSGFALYIVSTVHTLTAGTDRTNVVFRWSALASVQMVFLLTAIRLVTTRRLKRALRGSGTGAVDRTRAERLEEVRAHRDSTPVGPGSVRRRTDEGEPGLAGEARADAARTQTMRLATTRILGTDPPRARDGDDVPAADPALAARVEALRARRASARS